MRGIVRGITGLALFVLSFFAIADSVRMAWSDEGLTGQIRTTFVEAAMRSCIKAQIDIPANKAIPISAIFEYCKCFANATADKISNEEVTSLEATGDEKKYAEALHSRTEATSKACQEEVRKTLLKSN